MQTGAAKALHTRDLKSGLDVGDPALRDAWGLLADGSATGWALYGYDAAVPSKIVVAATGSGAAALLAALREDQVYFGALCARAGKPRPPLLLSFLWVGPAVGGLKRGKAALHRNAVEQGAMESGLLKGEVSLWDEETEAAVTEEELRRRVAAAVGEGVEGVEVAV